MIKWGRGGAAGDQLKMFFSIHYTHVLYSVPVFETCIIIFFHKKNVLVCNIHSLLEKNIEPYYYSVLIMKNIVCAGHTQSWMDGNCFLCACMALHSPLLHFLPT